MSSSSSCRPSARRFPRAVMPPWSHSESIAFDAAGRDEFRRQHGLEGKFVVMYSGNHSPCHPLDTLLEAVALVVLVVTQLSNYVFVPVFGHAGLALSIGLGAMVNAAWLLYGLRARGLYRASPGWLGFLLRLLPANLALGLWLGWTSQAIDWLAWRGHALLRAGALTGAIAVGAVVYFGLLWLVGLRPQGFLRRA